VRLVEPNPNAHVHTQVFSDLSLITAISNDMGYEHVFAKITGGNLSPQAAELVGWLTGTKLSAGIDYVALEGSAGLIPQCAMRVRRSSDGGLLSPYTPPESCHCAFTAAITRTLPPDCVACTGNAMCTGGKVCRRGFCE